MIGVIFTWRVISITGSVDTDLESGWGVLVWGGVVD
jgi:hypothetical protein